MLIKKYAIKFYQISRYSLKIVLDMRGKIRKFASGMSREMIFESKTVLLIKDIDILWLVVHME